MNALLPAIQENFPELGWPAARALPFMDAGFKKSLTAAVLEFKAKQSGGPVAESLWRAHPPRHLGRLLHSRGFCRPHVLPAPAFPDIIGTDETLRGFDYVLGTHPVNNVSYVSTVGTASKLIAYGNNRADYTFIPGGMIPGVVIIEPDFPELKEQWPFLWYENEYVVDAASTFILAANAAEALAR